MLEREKGSGEPTKTFVLMEGVDHSEIFFIVQPVGTDPLIHVHAHNNNQTV